VIEYVCRILDQKIPYFEEPISNDPPQLQLPGILTRAQSRKLGQESIEHIIPSKGKNLK
jgi:hypothetical protein